MVYGPTQKKACEVYLNKLRKDPNFKEKYRFKPETYERIKLNKIKKDRLNLAYDGLKYLFV